MKYFPFPVAYLNGYFLGDSVFLYTSHLLTEKRVYSATDWDKRAYYAHCGNYFAAH